MKKAILTIILCAALLIVMTGCEKSESMDDVYNKIGKYFGNENVDRSNLGAYYIDAEKNVIIVELIDASDKKQEEFKKLVIDSTYIEFKQGGPYTNHNYDDYEKISTLHSNDINTTILVKFDGILYGKSYGIIDYAGGTNSIGVIDKLIAKQYVPKFNGETNTKEILNALAFDKTEKTIVLFYNNEYVLFEKI